MVLLKIKPVAGFREKGFKAELIETGIAPFGQDEKLKAYMKFADDPDSMVSFYVTDPDGNSLFEPDEETGETKIKAYGFGKDISSFVQSLPVGYSANIDVDGRAFEITDETNTSCVGRIFEMLCTAQTSTKGEDAKLQTFYKFTVKSITEKGGTTLSKGKVPVNTTNSGTNTNINKTGGTGSGSGVPEATMAAWKEFLLTTSLPLNSTGLVKAVNAMYPPGDSDPEVVKANKAKRDLMYPLKDKALMALVKCGFLTVDSSGKYSLGPTAQED